MSTRGGAHYDRTFKEAYIRPGIGKAFWGNRSNYAVTGIHPTGESEMSIYVHPNRRYVLRTDGFSSLNAGYAGGEMITKPLTCRRSRLELNCSTSAGGSLRVEIQDADGDPIPGFDLDSSRHFIGDEIATDVTWGEHGNSDVSKLSGTPIRLRFVMQDADLFALRFN